MATTEQALEAQRQARIKAEQLAWENAQRGYTVAQEDITKNADKLAQETWTQKKVQEKALPNVMQQAGLSTTGYTETTANNINTNYQNAWNQVMGNKQTGLRDVGIAKANAENDFNARLANVEADYQASLAQYLASIKKTGGTGGTGDGGGNTETTSTILKGLDSIQFDPSKGLGFDTNDNPQAGIAPLYNYLMKYVQSGAISKETAWTWLNNHISKYTQGQRQGGTSPATATTTTTTKTAVKPPVAPASITKQQQYINRGNATGGSTKTGQVIAY